MSRFAEMHFSELVNLASVTVKEVVRIADCKLLCGIFQESKSTHPLESTSH